MARVRLVLPDMTCRGAVRAVTGHLRDVPGVVVLNANAETGELWVTGEVPELSLRRELDAIGFAADGTPGAAPVAGSAD